MSKIIDRVGEVYGRLTVIERDLTRKSKSGAYWICKCSCGKKISVLTNNLRSGGTTSCGCGKAEDLTGKTYGEWLVLERDNTKKDVYWKCKCSCGIVKSILAKSLKSGNSKSCGHGNSERCKEQFTKHGMRYTRFYQIWQDMSKRCYDKKNKQYENYGGRGIEVCESWREDFINFKNDMYESYIKHSEQNGEEDTTIERIDPDKDYCKENCTWATRVQQTNNRRCTIKVEINGREFTLRDIVDKTGIPYSTLLSRHKRGNDILRADELEKF